MFCFFFAKRKKKLPKTIYRENSLQKLSHKMFFFREAEKETFQSNLGKTPYKFSVSISPPCPSEKTQKKLRPLLGKIFKKTGYVGAFDVERCV